MKVKTLKAFIWTNNLPKFEADTEYEVRDEIGSQMVKYGYAELCCDCKKAPKKEKKMEKLDQAENKMLPSLDKCNKAELISNKKTKAPVQLKRKTKKKSK